jgi:hypothetical protein
MPQTYQRVARCAPSRHQDVYVFAIAPIAHRGLAAITSADEVILLDRGTLTEVASPKVPDAPRGLASFAVADEGQTLVCAGQEGTVAAFDLRTGASIAHYRAGIWCFQSRSRVVMSDWVPLQVALSPL